MTDLEGAVELDEAHRALTAASRRLPELWEQPHKAAEGVVVKPQHLRLILAALKAARRDYHTKAREADDALASITRERDAMREAHRPYAAVSAKAKGKDDDCWCGQDGAVIRYRDLRLSAALVNGGEEISSKALPSKGLGGFERAKEISLCAAWLDECARYFEKRPTNGEDAAHWANVANAVNARKYAALVRSFAALVNGEGGK